MKRLLSFAPCVLVALIAACPKHVDEPDSKPAATSGASSSSYQPTASPPAPGDQKPNPAATGDFSPIERRLFAARIQRDRCEEAGKHFNQVNGRPDFDKHKMTLFLISGCLGMGNQAWDQCQQLAKTADEYKKCSGRYLIPADELK